MLLFLFDFSARFSGLGSSHGYSSFLALVTSTKFVTSPLLKLQREISGSELFSVKSRKPLIFGSLKIASSFGDICGPCNLNRPVLEDFLRIYSSHEVTFGLTQPAYMFSSFDMLVAALVPICFNRHRRKLFSGRTTNYSPISRFYFSRVFWTMTMTLILGFDSKFGLARPMYGANRYPEVPPKSIVIFSVPVVGFALLSMSNFSCEKRLPIFSHWNRSIPSSSLLNDRIFLPHCISTRGQLFSVTIPRNHFNFFTALLFSVIECMGPEVQPNSF